MPRSDFDPMTHPSELDGQNPAMPEEMLMIPVKATPALYLEILKHAPKGLLAANAAILLEHLTRVDRLPEVLKAVALFVAEKTGIQDKVADKLIAEATKAFLADLPTFLSEPQLKAGLVPRLLEAICEHPDTTTLVTSIVREDEWIKNALKEALAARIDDIAAGLIQKGPIRTRINAIGQQVMDEISQDLDGMVRKTAVEAAARKGHDLVELAERSGYLGVSQTNGA
jgi:hypothetical protein